MSHHFQPNGYGLATPRWLYRRQVDKERWQLENNTGHIRDRIWPD